LYIKTIILPRQARDKHRGNSEKQMAFFAPPTRRNVAVAAPPPFDDEPCRNAFSLNRSYVCPEPVLANDAVFSLKWHREKGVSAPAPRSGCARICPASLRKKSRSSAENTVCF
jgi:hypothetical protein